MEYLKAVVVRYVAPVMEMSQQCQGSPGPLSGPPEGITGLRRAVKCWSQFIKGEVQKARGHKGVSSAIWQHV